MSFVYLTVDQIVAINADQDGGVGVRDLAGVESTTHRPQSGGFGHEPFPDIWLKAAAYVHGFGSTQHFYDGNKRTAWFSAVTFLRLNGHPLPDVPTIEAETFVQAIAQNVFTTDDEPAITVVRAAEWLRSKWENQPPVPGRFGWAALAKRVDPTDIDGVVNVEHLGIARIGVSELSTAVDVNIIVRCRYLPEDIGQRHQIDIAMEYQRYPICRLGYRQFPFYMDPPAAVGDPHHYAGIQPATAIGMFRLIVEGEGTTRIVVSFDGRLLVKLPVTTIVNPGMGEGWTFSDLNRPDWLDPIG